MCVFPNSKVLSITFRLDFSSEVTLDKLAESMLFTGFQATNVGLAIKEINNMVCGIM